MTQYVKEMRKMIGTLPLLLCGASAIIFDNQQRVLMVQRSDNNSWCFPGGSIDLGESTEEAAKREVLEETGLIVNNLELFDVFSGEELHYIYPHGDEVYVVDVVYLTSDFSGQIRLDNESKSYEFFQIDNIPNNISPPVKPVIRKLKERMKV